MKTIREGEKFRFIRKERTGLTGRFISPHITKNEAVIEWTVNGWMVYSK